MNKSYSNARRLALANRKVDPMRVFFAVQQQVAGNWETNKLFYTNEFAQAYINKNIGNFRIEQVERDIND